MITVSVINGQGAVLHSTEVAFALLNQRPRVRFSHLTAGNFRTHLVVLMKKDFANAVSGEGQIISTATKKQIRATNVSYHIKPGPDMREKEMI